MFGRKMFILSISPCNIQGFMKLHTHSIQHILYPIGIEGGTKSQLLAITLNSRFSSYPYFQFFYSVNRSQIPEHKRNTKGSVLVCTWTQKGRFRCARVIRHKMLLAVSFTIYRFETVNDLLNPRSDSSWTREKLIINHTAIFYYAG